MIVLLTLLTLQAGYGFAVKGGATVQGAVLTWDAEPRADNYIVSWTEHPDISNLEHWHDVALTWDPQHIDNIPHRKDIPQHYRVRAVRWDMAVPISETEVMSVIFPSFSDAGSYTFRFFPASFFYPRPAAPDMTVVLPASSDRQATMQWASNLVGPWRVFTGPEFASEMFFRIIVQ